jgi:hypothetical protein
VLEFMLPLEYARRCEDCGQRCRIVVARYLSQPKRERSAVCGKGGADLSVHLPERLLG